MRRYILTSKIISFKVIMIGLITLGNNAFAEVKISKKHPLSTSVSFSTLYNQLETTDVKKQRNSIGYGISYKSQSGLIFHGGINASYLSQNLKVFRTSDSKPFFSFSDFHFGAAKNYSIDNSLLSNHSLNVSVALPISEESQFEAYRANLILGYGLSTKPLFKGIAASYGFSINYLWNHFKYGNLSQSINRDYIISNKIGLSATVFKRVFLTAVARASFINYLDNTQIMNYGTVIGAGTNYKNFSFSVALINNSYPEDEYFNPGYFDQYKQLIKLGVKYVF